jgi:D-alanine-D-alanine ligase
MNIALLFGGRSGEHEVSLRSAASVYENLDKTQYDITLIGIAKDGIWYCQQEPVIQNGSFVLSQRDHQRVYMAPGKGFFVSEKTLKVDMVLPILHGTFGEDGTLQGLLEMMGIPYIGAGVAGSYLGMDKEVAKVLWINAGLPVVPYRMLRSHETKIDGFSLDSWVGETAKRFDYPLYIKPSRAGSSVGVSRAETPEQFKAALAEALRYDTKVLVEPGINARELECSVIGNTEVTAFPPGEIIPTHKFYDYEAKYQDPDGARLDITADLPAKKKKEISDIAAAAYLTAECRGFARVDLFMDKNDGRIYINEINTIPGFTSISMFPKMCEAGGIPFSVLLDKLIVLGLEEFRIRQELTYNYTK